MGESSTYEGSGTSRVSSSDTTGTASSIQSQSGSGQTEEKTQTYLFLFLATSCVLFAVISIVLGMIAFKQGMLSPEELDLEEGSSGGGGGGALIGGGSGSQLPLSSHLYATPGTKKPSDTSTSTSATSTTPTTTTTTSTTTMTTPTTAAPTTTTMAKTTRRTGPPTTTQKPLPVNSLICTVSEEVKRPFFRYPKDGLCAIIFYDSLYKNPANTLNQPHQDLFQYFLETAALHRITEYGIGFDFSKRNDMRRMAANPFTKTNLERLWNNRVYHYGHINTPQMRTTARHRLEMLTSLKIIKDLMKAGRDLQVQPIYTALMFPFFSKSLVTSTITDMRSTIFVDILIGLAHQHIEDKVFVECRMMPQTYLDTNDRSVYPYPLRLWHSVFEEFARAHLRIPLLAVSLHVGARRYVPRQRGNAGDPGYGTSGLTHRCKYDKAPMVQRLANYCGHDGLANFFYNKATKSEYTIGTLGYTVTHETPLSLRTKFCEAKQNYTSFKYAIAAYGVDFLDYRNQCAGLEKYKKLSFLNKLLRFLNDNYTTPAAFRECSALPLEGPFRV